MKLEDFKTGIIIIGSKWPEPVEIKKVELFESYLHVIGSTTESRQHMDQIIAISELSDFQISSVDIDFKTESWKTFLALETKRYRLASLYDPLLAMNSSKVDPLPHQLDAVYGHILKLPRIRFLIADDPGAGKTIMTGLTIKELKLRRIINKILIVVPGHLRDQWIRELKDRFEETFTSINRSYVDAHYGESVWEKESQIITSIDFIKREDILPSIISTHFDLIVVDEAHKMSAYRYGDKTKKTDRYELGEILSEICEHMIFLTATPHKGDPENFRLFIDLLEPGFFADSKLLKTSISNKENPLFIRRIKEDLKDFNGKPLFLPRSVETIAFSLTDCEMDLYNDVSSYVKEQFNKALVRDKRRNVTFALIILQRRLTSSTFALLRSLERRKNRLNELFKKVIENKNEKLYDSFTLLDFEEIEDLREAERWKEEEIWETLSVAENKKELQREIEIIENLIIQANKIIQNENEVKLNQLKEMMNELQNKSENNVQNNTKILIFTESKDTLDYLAKKIRSWGYSTNIIHGGMKLEERVRAESIFKNETQVLIATEAAGEGINLQFCNMMINYDLPWNPNRLEQRMGRIHRYGQQKEVFIFNLVSHDTREGKVMKRIFEKLDEIKNTLQSDKVFDVIGEVFYGKNLSQLFLEAAANVRNIDEILNEVDIKVDEKFILKVKENLGESLATRYIDYSRINEMAEKARENKLIPEYTRAFFIKAFQKAQGKIRERKDGYMSIDSIPYDLKIVAEEPTFKKRYGLLLRTYPKITFEKEIAFKNPDSEFITFGHPLFEAILTWIEKKFSSHLQKGSIFEDPSGKLNGYVLFYEGELRDGKGEIVGIRLFSNYIGNKILNESPITIPPSLMWDLSEESSIDSHIILDSLDQQLTKNRSLEILKKIVLKNVISELEKYKKEIQIERDRQATIKEKYGLASLEQLIIKLDGDLIDLYRRRDERENVQIAIRNKEEQKKRYENSKQYLYESIKKEKSITMSMPRFVGIICIRPRLTIDDSLKTDPEVEIAGMNFVMCYEKNNGRIPEDVSSENLGFDIRSRDSNGKARYIEVKSRSNIGSVSLTQNEWFNAQRFRDDYYLHVVYNATKDSISHHVIQNPVLGISTEEKIETVRYLISSNEIRKY